MSNDWYVQDESCIKVEGESNFRRVTRYRALGPWRESALDAARDATFGGLTQNEIAAIRALDFQGDSPRFALLDLLLPTGAIAPKEKSLNVRKWQVCLGLVGFYCRVDDAMGPETVNATNDFRARFYMFFPSRRYRRSSADMGVSTLDIAAMRTALSKFPS